jgi:hypothetical protein
VEQTQFTAEELEQLRWANRRLEHPSLAARLSNIIGSPIEQGMRLLPANWYKRLDAALDASIQKSLALAIDTMRAPVTHRSNGVLHNVMAMGAGAVGGFFGPLALLAELPVTTTIMLRAIADIAQREGEDMSNVEARMACMQVFALGGRTGEDEAAESGYYGLRLMLGFHFSSSVLQMGNRKSVIPAGVEFVRAVSARFGVVVTDKAAAQMVPIAGAFSAALLNLIFTQHFQDIARGHFIIRRLERKYGSNPVKRAYQRINKEAETVPRSYSTLEGW